MNVDDNKYNWDLDLLFKGDNDSKILSLRKRVKIETSNFIAKWEKRSDYLKNPVTLKKALDEYEHWIKNYNTATQEWYYFSLRSSLNQDYSKVKARLNQITDFGLKIQNGIQFFELRIAKIEKGLQQKFLKSKLLKNYRHFLFKLFEQAKYQLTEPEEMIMNLKSTTSHTNWVRMTSAFLAKEERGIVNKAGKISQKNFSEITSLMNDKDKKIRDSAALSFNEILSKHVEVAEHELNSVLQNKKTDDELRNYKRPDISRHIIDDIETDVVDTLVDVVTSNFETAKKFYQLKAKLMGVKRLEYHERNVPFGKINKEFTYSNALEIISKVTHNLDQDFYSIFQDFVKQRRIDVYPKKGKKGGAFCTYGLPINPTFILLNYTNQINDVLTLAHELGHGIHFEFSKKQNAINFGTTVATTEVASTFMEDFVLQELEKKAYKELELALLTMKLNDDVSTIFRQIAFYNFETELHKKFRKKGYLSKEEIGKLFQKHMDSYMGNAVEQSKGSQNWWVYVSHFRYFFYVYSYASGLLISKALQSSVKKNPKYIDKVKIFLSAGTSKSAKNIFKELGINLSDKKIWLDGIIEVKTSLERAEKLAKELGKI